MNQFIRDNAEEAGIGFLLGLGFFWAMGWWCVLLGLITGVAYRLGGSGWLGTKAWRRIGIPVLLVLSMWSLSLLIRIPLGLVTFGLLTIGYGTITYDNQGKVTDEGSPYGNFWLDLVGEKWGKVLSRAVIMGGIWTVWLIAYLVR